MSKRTSKGLRTGRPPRFNNCLDLDAACELYFQSCFVEVDSPKDADATDEWHGKPVYLKQIRPFTITGLANSVGLDREGLIRYEHHGDDFYNTLKRHKARVQEYVEEYLFRGKNQIGAIFNLKNNFNWVDRHEQEISGKLGLDDLLRAIGQEDPEKANAIRQRLKVLAGGKR